MTRCSCGALYFPFMQFHPAFDFNLQGGKNFKAKPEIDLEEHPVVLDGSNDCDDATKGASCHSAAGDDEDRPEICLGNEIVEDESIIDDPRPPKKTKSPIDDNMCSAEVING